MKRALLSTALIVVFAACPAPPQQPPPPDGELSSTQLLSRISMALRGVRPSIDDLTAVQNDPAALDSIVDEYLDSPEFAATIRDMHAEQMLIGVDPIIYPAGFPARGALTGREVQDLNLKLLDAPLKLVEHVVMQELPYHEILTADYAMVNEETAIVFGQPFNASGAEWQEVQYDDREHAGLLSDSMIFTRISSTPSNKNRGRAAYVANTFLCYDFLSRQVELDTNIDLSDEAAVANAIQNNPACQSCHQTLDPLAAHFANHFPIYVPAFLEDFPFEFMQNPLARYMTAADPAYFGTPTRGLRDLGILMASDPRFSMCTARRFTSWFTQQERDDIAIDDVSYYNDVFLSEAMDAKALVKAIVTSEEFRVAAATENDDDAEAEELRGVLVARPEQLSAMVEDLTGYVWATSLPLDFLGIGIIGDIDLMSDALLGFSTLAGGTDSQSVPRPAGTVSATSTLVLEQLAAHAAPFVVENDFAESDKADRKLLTLVDDDTTDEAQVRAQLVELELRMFGETVATDSQEITDLYALWKTASDPRRAWEITIYALLRDVRATTY